MDMVNNDMVHIDIATDVIIDEYVEGVGINKCSPDELFNIGERIRLSLFGVCLKRFERDN